MWAYYGPLCIPLSLLARLLSRCQVSLRKVDDQLCVFNRTWTAKYFFTEFNGKAVCLICGTQVAVLKDYHLYHYYMTKHEDKHTTLSEKEHARVLKFIKEQLLDSVAMICSEKKDVFDVSLSHHIKARQVEDIAGNLEIQL